MATEVDNIFITKKEKSKCNKCNTPIPKGEFLISPNEVEKGICFACSPYKNYTFLPSGNVALTRRSKKHSNHCGAVLEWNARRKRFERRGQYVSAVSIEVAKAECAADEEKRAAKNEKAAIKRAADDKIYIADFAKAIKNRYPNCPINRETEIAQHACEKHSGRVGRTASAKEFNAEMIDLAVEAHIRHTETNYDDQFGLGKKKRDIRQDIKGDVLRIMTKWKQN